MGADDGGGWSSAASRRLLELTVDLVCVTGFDGSFRELSGGWPDLLGYTCDELMGRRLLDLVHPDDVARTTDELAAGEAGGEITRFQNRLVAHDGTSRWLLWSAIAVSGERCFRAVAHDLTAQHDAAERIRDSERRYFDLIESSHDIVQSIGADGHFEFVNKAWHDHLGYSADELPGITLFDIIDEADHEHCSVLMGQIMTGRSLERVEVTFVAKDGHRFPVEGNATGRFRDGEFMATHTFFRDVSERKKAEALASQYQHQLEEEVAERTTALVRSEKLATLGRLSAGMAHELNNPAAAAQRGAAQLRESLWSTCRGFFDLARVGLSGDEAEALSDLVTRSADRAKLPDSLDPVSRSDREAEVEDWLEAQGVDGAWDLAGPVVSLGFDVNELDDLAGRFSRSQLPMVLALMSQSFTAFALLEQIGHGSQRISQIVTALKDYSFMDRAPVQDIDVHEGIDNTLVMLQAKLKGGIEVERAYGSDIPRIDALGSELNQVWTNLIDNAVDAMGGSGHLVLRTSATDGAIVVEVEDDGPGISPEHLAQVFDPFFTTKLPGHGTGLGLNIVFNIVHGSGGHIDVRSEPGRTVFRVRVPTHRHAPEVGVDA